MAWPALAAPVSGSQDEYALKAQILVHLAAYVKWPGPARQGKPFVIAVIGTSPFGQFLSEYAGKHTVHGRPIEVQNWTWTRQPPDCDMAFICRSEQGAAGEIRAWAAEHAVLTACEAPRLVREGVMAGVVLEANRVKIHLNHQALLGQGFTPGSELMGMVKLVGPDGPSR